MRFVDRVQGQCPSERGTRRQTGLPALFALVVAAALLTGCGVSGPSVGGGAAANSKIQLSGRIFGGQQPVYHSLIQVWAAGISGDYGTGASDQMLATVYSAADGSFSITNDYACPSNGAPVYITATGGDPSGNASSFNNDALKLVTALGACGNLQPTTNITINEVTTAAAAFALAQFYGGFGGTADMIGAPATNRVGLTNAFATAHNLANTVTGTATPTTAASGTNYFMIAADQQKLNSIANVLADCVNQSTNGSTACSTLFADVTPTHAPLSTTTTATAPVNTFQAAVYMALNPVSTNGSGAHLSELFAMQSAFAPFAPALSSAPTDWTLALQYSGTGINYNSSVAIDANGDIWLSNANTPGGVVLLNGGTGTVGGTPGIAGGVIGYYSGPSAYPTIVPSGVRQLAIDLNGKAWFGTFNGTGTTTASGSTNYYVFRATGGAGTDGYFPLPSGAGPYGIAIDPGNEVFSMCSSGGALGYLSGTATSGTSLTMKYVGNSSNVVSLGIDTNKNGYLAMSNNTLIPFNSGTQAIGTTASAAATGFSSPYGVAVDGSNRLWVANDPASSPFLTIYDPSNTTTPFSNITSSCLQKPGFVAFDGNGNAWVSNQSATIGSNYTVCEFDSHGNLISNAIGFGSHGLNLSRGVGVDLSGNVWVSNYIQSSSNTVTELVGAAVPAVTPISVAIKNGKVGTRP